jgi:hypothetical protein
MPDHLSRAQRYRDRANECRHLAALAISPETRKAYTETAGYYDLLAEAELALAGRRE